MAIELCIITDFLRKSVVMTTHVAPYWLGGIAIGSAVAQVFSTEKIKKSRILQGFPGVIAGALLGVISPIGLYGAVPITGALAAANVPFATIFSFLISTPLINPNLFIFTAGVFGYPMALARLLSALLLGITSGSIILLLGRIKKESLLVPVALSEIINSKKSRNGKDRNESKPGFTKGFIREFTHFLRFSSPYFFLAIVISVLIEMFVPRTVVQNLLGSRNPFSVVIATGLSVPLYLCGGNTIPFIHELVNSGMNRGAALAFFIAGPATKISNITFLSSILGIRGISFFLTITLGASILLGYVFGYIIE